MAEHKSSIQNLIQKALILSIGSFIAAIGLEVFLIPNQIIDGGVVGLSILASYITNYPMGLFLIVFNLPFIYIGYRHIGKNFAFSTIFAICSLSYWVSFLHDVPVLTTDLFLTSVFGGIVLGFGVGMIIRYGGSLDGTEIIAIILDKKTSFSVGEIIMFFNIFILGSAGLVFSLDRVMYSLVTYFVAFKIIDITIGGLEESRGVMIISEKSDEIADALMVHLGRGVTLLQGRGGYSRENRDVLYSVITRLEMAKLKVIIDEIDKEAFIAISEVYDVMGGRFKKKAIH